jgi:CheY-like chemotaxis protein
MSAAAPQPRPASVRPRVIVIDDDPLFRNLLVSVLRRDYLVSVACEGSEGYYKSLEHTPDLAVIDIQMPGWDGLKTLQAFRSNAQLSRVIIVMLTAEASRETVVAAVKGGANDYVIKTKFSREDFLHKLGQLLQPQVRPPAATERPPAPALTLVEWPPPVAQPFNDWVATPHAFNPVDGVAQREPDLQEVLDAWE